MTADALNTEALSVSMSALEDAWTRKKDATEDYRAEVEAVALKSGFDASVIRAYVNARMAERTERDKRKAEQLSLCFDQLGA